MVLKIEKNNPPADDSGHVLADVRLLDFHGLPILLANGGDPEGPERTCCLPMGEHSITLTFPPMDSFSKALRCVA